MAYLECQDVSKVFGSVLALSSTSFSIAEGEHLAITGPSGAGKSTLLGILAGLLAPTTGAIFERGRSVCAAGQAPLDPSRRSLGVLLQGLGLWPHLTVLQNVEFAIVPSSIPGQRRERRQARRDRAEKALDRVGLLRLADRYPREISGGEKQRAAWARATVAEPGLLLLDEPLSSLDPNLEQDLLGLVEAYGSAPGRTVIMVTHRPEVMSRFAKRVLRLPPAAPS